MIKVLTRSQHQQRVDEFMRLASQELPIRPVEKLSNEVRILRARLIIEEVLELITDGLGVNILVKGPGGALKLKSKDIKAGTILFEATNSFNLEEVVDGCCDLKVVITGTLSACGIADEYPQEEVDNNNLAKFGPGHIVDSYGKLQKPPGHVPPNIKLIIKNQKEAG